MKILLLPQHILISEKDLKKLASMPPRWEILKILSRLLFFFRLSLLKGMRLPGTYMYVITLALSSTYNAIPYLSIHAWETSNHHSKPSTNHFN